MAHLHCRRWDSGTDSDSDPILGFESESAACSEKTSA